MQSQGITSAAFAIPLGLIQHSLPNLSPVPIYLNDARSQIDPTFFIRDVVPNHLQEQLTSAISRSQADAFELSPRSSGAQHSEIALREELCRDLLTEGQQAGLVADRSMLVVQRDAVDRSERGDFNPTVAASKTVDLELWKLKQRGL